MKARYYVFLFCFGFLGLGSCKKDRTCVCEAKQTYTTSAGVVASTYTSTTTIQMKGVSKREANRVCVDRRIGEDPSGQSDFTILCDLK